ncbi:MAG: hypothetical protein WAM28_07405 [Chlamydiales bacterium]
MNSKNTDVKNTEYSNYCIRVSENIYQKVDRLVHILKQADSPGHTKQKWLTEAIKEKLEIENHLSSDDFPKEKQLSVKLAIHLRKKIEKRVTLIKKFRTSYSIKQWIMEAIFEKLDRDIERTAQLLEEISDTL